MFCNVVLKKYILRFIKQHFKYFHESWSLINLRLATLDFCYIAVFVYEAVPSTFLCYICNIKKYNIVFFSSCMFLLKHDLYSCLLKKKKKKMECRYFIAKYKFVFTLMPMETLSIGLLFLVTVKKRNRIIIVIIVLFLLLLLVTSIKAPPPIHWVRYNIFFYNFIDSV